ncbi:MAG: histone deacetylase, partial [Planctomycetota bacterium]
MKLYYSDTFELPLPASHRFPMSKYTLLRERISQGPLGKICQLEIPPAASNAQLQRVHTEAYVAKIQTGRLTDVEMRR